MSKVYHIEGFEEMPNNNELVLSSVIKKTSKDIFDCLRNGEFISPYTKPYTNYRRLTNQHNNLVTKNNTASVPKAMIQKDYYGIDPKIFNIFDSKEKIEKLSAGDIRIIQQRLNKKNNVPTPLSLGKSFINVLNNYKDKGGVLLFEGGFFPDSYESKGGPVDSLIIKDGLLNISYVQYDDPDPIKVYSKEELGTLLAKGKKTTDQILISDLFNRYGDGEGFSFNCG